MNTQQKIDHMAKLPIGKTFTIPAYGDLGPAHVELTLPQVRITDSAGQVIGISPRQAELLAMALDSITSWFEDVEDIPEDVSAD